MNTVSQEMESAPHSRRTAPPRRLAAGARSLVGDRPGVGRGSDPGDVAACAGVPTSERLSPPGLAGEGATQPRRLTLPIRRAAREQAAVAHEPPPSPDELASRLELQRTLAECTVRLPEPYRSTIVLRYNDGLTAEAIARHKGLPPGTVRSHLSRALDELRAGLDRGLGSRDVCSSSVPRSFGR
jgi:RNA polymerase sigma factor (sigma-70 family)